MSLYVYARCNILSLEQDFHLYDNTKIRVLR